MSSDVLLPSHLESRGTASLFLDGQQNKIRNESGADGISFYSAMFLQKCGKCSKEVLYWYCKKPMLLILHNTESFPVRTCVTVLKAWQMKNELEELRRQGDCATCAKSLPDKNCRVIREIHLHVNSFKFQVFNCQCRLALMRYWFWKKLAYHRLLIALIPLGIIILTSME